MMKSVTIAYVLTSRFGELYILKLIIAFFGMQFIILWRRKLQNKLKKITEASQVKKKKFSTAKVSFKMPKNTKQL